MLRGALIILFTVSCFGKDYYNVGGHDGDPARADECPNGGWVIDGMPVCNGADGEPGKDGEDGSDGEDGLNTTPDSGSLAFTVICKLGPTRMKDGELYTCRYQGVAYQDGGMIAFGDLVYGDDQQSSWAIQPLDLDLASNRPFVEVPYTVHGDPGNFTLGFENVGFPNETFSCAYTDNDPTIYFLSDFSDEVCDFAYPNE